MSVLETFRIIVSARREGVTLFVRADGKLGWKANSRPSDELLAVLAEHKADILALLPPPPRPSFAIGPAKAIAARLRMLQFRAHLDDHGGLLITDMTWRRRDVSWFFSVVEVFDTIVAGLADDPALLDS